MFSMTRPSNYGTNKPILLEVVFAKHFVIAMRKIIQKIGTGVRAVVGIIIFIISVTTNGKSK